MLIFNKKGQSNETNGKTNPLIDFENISLIKKLCLKYIVTKVKKHKILFNPSFKLS